MGWFKKTMKSKRLDDKIFLNEKAKYANFILDLESKIIQSEPLMICYYFNETAHKIISKLEEKQIKYRKMESELMRDINLQLDTGVLLIKAKTISQASKISVYNHQWKEKNTHIFFAEHYPFFSKEEMVLKKIDDLTACKAEICFYMSLDEPLFRIFGSDNIQKLMLNMGLDENNSIEHPFVNKSIVNAQKKIEKKVVSESECNSQEEWFGRYFPG